MVQKDGRKGGGEEGRAIFRQRTARMGIAHLAVHKLAMISPADE